MKRILHVKHQQKLSGARFLLAVLCLFLSSGVLLAQDIRITGTVVDDQGQPVIGASVIVKGTTRGTSAGLNGEYALTVPGTDAVLEFGMLGYNTVEERVGNRTTINVVLSEEATALEEVVVVGFGTQKKVNLTGAVSSVSAEVLENRPVANIGQALQGLVPNLNVSIANGAPNEVPSFNLRGGTSMSYNSTNKVWQVDRGEPLILIDNVPADATRLNQMNPNDIQSMSFIKDASAAAIYGTRATYGVILVTTKSGNFNQKAQVSYSYDISLDQAAYKPDILDSYTVYLAQIEKRLWTTGGVITEDEQTRLDALAARRDNPNAPNYYMRGDEIQGSIVWVDNVNPFKTALNDWAPMQKHNLSISGGNDKTAYHISLGYQDQEGMYSINTDKYKRYNSMISLTTKVNDWLNVNSKATFNSVKYTAPYMAAGKSSNIWSTMLGGEWEKNLMMPIRTGPNDPVPNAPTDNILSWLDTGAKTQSVNNTIMLSIAPEIIILPELKFKTEFSFRKTNYKLNRRIPEREYVTGSWLNLVSEQTEGQYNKHRVQRDETQQYTLNVFADYNKTFGNKHNVAAIVGFNQEEYKASELNVEFLYLFNPDIPGKDNSEKPDSHVPGYGAREYATRAGFGRVTYNYDNRYFIEMNGRYDGSSRFPKDDRYQFFPSFSGAWRISEEPFMKNVQWVDNLKIRGSWGKLGNQGSRYYGYQSTFGKGSGFLIGGDLVSWVNMPSLVAPNLKWEKARTVDIGLDFMLLNNRVDFTFDWYDRLTTDILIEGSAVYPSLLGINPPYENSGELRARGWEMQVTWRDKLKNGLRYSVTLSLGDEQTKVESFASNDEQKNLNYLYKGRKTGDIWGYEVGGILQESDLEFNPANNTWVFYGPNQSKINSNLYPGYLWYKDQNGDGLVSNGQNTRNDPGDMKLLGNSTARYKYGININMDWKGFDLNLFFQGVGKKDLYLTNGSYWGGNNAGNWWMYDRAWRPDRTDAKYPMYGSPTGTSNDRYLFDASYFKLKQAVLGYTIPKEITQKIGLERVRVNVSGYNLFSISDLPKHFDPEQVSDRYPMKRTVAFGIQIGF